MSQPPNKALQRTRSAPLRSPLSFKALGDGANHEDRAGNHLAAWPAPASCTRSILAGADRGSDADEEARSFRLNGFRHRKLRPR